MNKDMARRLMRSRQRTARMRTPKNAPHPNDVRRPLDTWSPRQVEKFKQDLSTDEQKGASRPWGLGLQVPEIPVEAPSPAPEKPTRSPEELRRYKRRATKVSIATSQEEADIIKEYVRHTGMSLAEWGREVLFAAMGKKIPPRH